MSLIEAVNNTGNKYKGLIDVLRQMTTTVAVCLTAFSLAWTMGIFEGDIIKSPIWETPRYVKDQKKVYVVLAYIKARNVPLDKTTGLTASARQGNGDRRTLELLSVSGAPASAEITRAQLVFVLPDDYDRKLPAEVYFSVDYRTGANRISTVVLPTLLFPAFEE